MSRSRAESHCRKYVFEDILDSYRESFHTDFEYYGIINISMVAICSLDDRKVGQVYLALENRIINDYYRI